MRPHGRAVAVVSHLIYYALTGWLAVRALPVIGGHALALLLFLFVSVEGPAWGSRLQQWAAQDVLRMLGEQMRRPDISPQDMERQ